MTVRHPALLHRYLKTRVRLKRFKKEGIEVIRGTERLQYYSFTRAALQKCKRRTLFFTFRARKLFDLYFHCWHGAPHDSLNCVARDSVHPIRMLYERQKISKRRPATLSRGFLRHRWTHLALMFFTLIAYRLGKKQNEARSEEEIKKDKQSRYRGKT